VDAVESWAQRRRRRDIERRLRALDRLDRRNGLGSGPTARRHRTVDWHGVAALFLTVGMAAGLLVVVPGLAPASLRELVGLSASGSSGDGSYAFLARQSDVSRDPVGWDPCLPIRYVVNPDGGPSGALDLVKDAVARVEDASGMEFTYAGETNERPNWDSTFVPSIRAEEPVLVSWADPDEVPELAGDVAGIGGSVPTRGLTGRLRYVTGGVTLDTGTFTRLAERRDGEADARAIVLHEFGHVLGLAHVDDPGQLMHQDNLGLHDFGPGDLEGLTKLGQIPCS
jgi:Matrixin